jgi:hypothetical protein
VTMPWQLREGLKRRVKGAPPRPIVEKTPCISANDLKIPSQNDPKTYTLPNISLRYPWLVAARLSCEAIEFTIPSLHRGQPGTAQQFEVKHIRTGIGKAGYGIRHSFVCDCGEPVIKFYYLNRHIACRYCHRLVYASQTIDQNMRPVLQISRLESFLAKPRLLKARERLTKRLGQKLVMAQGKMGTKASRLWD